MKLFVFDFDHTIVRGHTHNAINRSRADGAISQEYANAHWGIVHDFPIIGSNDIWKTTFEALYQQGHHLCIASFNAYGSVISEFLSKIGLSEDFIQQINIISGLPKNPRTANKNNYIKRAIQKVQRSFPEEVLTEIILIDDSVKNIEAAKKQGYTTIQADQNGTHLQRLQQLINDYVPPVNRHLKPTVLEATALMTDQFTPAQAQGGWETTENVGCYSILTDPFRFKPTEEAIFADLSLNSDGSTTIHYGDQSSERFRDGCEAIKNMGCVSTSTEKFYYKPTEEEAIFADLSLNSEGSTTIRYGEQSGKHTSVKVKEKIKKQDPLDSKKPNWFHNYFFSQPKDNARANTEAALKENQSIPEADLSTIKRGS